jgi:4a-hydroxytetrahydrobiopterin dehydratase
MMSMPIHPLNAEQLQDTLRLLSGWTYDESRKALFCEIVLEDFTEAFSLMTRIALVAEKADHHPEWANVYNRLSIWLTTHDAGGVSEQDVQLAKAIDGMTA